MSIKEVLVIFKTHLDVGFTDYAENIISDYLKSFIPNAIRVGYELTDSKTPFVWTVGSWLIDQVLKNDTDGSVCRAVKDGILNWHGLPFTTHTELMNTAMLQYGIRISQSLDKRFGKKTIAAKMTDVPGHTIGMVPYLCRAGIKFLHIGVNPATPLPPVPDIFRWRCGSDEITVMYQGDYGETAVVGESVIYFAHTHDNCGPQNAEEIINIYDDIAKKYPEAEIIAATLNDVAKRVCNIDDLPVIEKEIGDTWIHGAATDPQKLSRYRKIQRYIAVHGSGDADLTDNALLVPEHTWGMDVKTFFNDTTHFTYKELDEVTEERKTIEASWEEQREYVRKAEKLLNITPDYPVEQPYLDSYTPSECEECTEIEISWQLFDNSDYERYKTDYMRLTDENRWWRLWDFTKIGLPDYKGGIFTAHTAAVYVCGEKRLYRLEFEDEIAKKYGLPYFYAEFDGNKTEIKWFGKKASRLPQAFWVKFNGFKEEWELNKMGQWIKPEDIIGSPLICGVDSGVRNGEYEIITEDAALAAPFGRRLLQYNVKELRQNLYFNLYNNIWNTNFPMWYSDDARFVFVKKKG